MNMYVPWLLLSHYQFGVKENEEKKINKKSFDSISFFKDFLKHHYLLFIFLGLEGAIVVTHPTADVTHTRIPACDYWILLKCLQPRLEKIFYSFCLSSSSWKTVILSDYSFWLQLCYHLTLLGIHLQTNCFARFAVLSTQDWTTNLPRTLSW